MKTIALLIAIAITCIFTGCMSYEPHVEMTEPWEGHYFSAEEFISKTKRMSLQKGQSVWVLSNQTLKRVLKNIKSGK